MVGRILTHLKIRGVLKEPRRNGISTRKRLWRRPYAIRKPREYPVREPGDLVQVDTLDVRPVPGVIAEALHRQRHHLPLGRGGSPH